MLVVDADIDVKSNRHQSINAFVFITISHHDVVYGETSAIYAQLEELYPGLWGETSARSGK